MLNLNTLKELQSFLPKTSISVISVSNFDVGDYENFF